MPRIVLLSAGLAGRTHELLVDKTTVGRVEDNTLQIPEPSVSSHHCEILLRGSEVVIKDLNSTNGTFINGEKITESVLQPGQTLRLGQIEMRLETEAGSAPVPIPAAAPAPAPAPAPSPAPAPASSKKPADQTLVMQRGVSLSDLEQGSRTGGFDTAGKGFSKKDNNVNKVFIILGAVMGVIILALLLYVFMIASK